MTDGRREDARLITGEACYVGDLMDGAAQCAFVRSSVAHGLVRTVDLDAVRRQPGVVATYAAADLGLAEIPGSTGRGPDAPAMGRPPLAMAKVRYVGEPLAVVVAETRHAAADAVEHAITDIDPLLAAVTLDSALHDEVLLFDAARTNVVSQTTVGAEPPVGADWPVHAEVAVDNPRLAPVPIEPLGVVAEPDGDGGLLVRCGHQAPHRLRGQLAALLGMPAGLIRVVVPDVGGAFGMKGMLYPEYVVVAAAARRLERAVAWCETRYEQMVGGTHGRGQRHHVALAGERDGRIRSARVTIHADLGAYPHNGSAIPLFTSYMASGPYAIPDLRVSTTMTVSNTAPIGSYRGAGRPEAAYAMERAVDAFAAACGVDPAAVRLRSFITPDAMPYDTPTGARYDGGDYAGALRAALAMVDADAVRSEQRTRPAHDPRRLGLGIGAFVERAGGAADSSEYTSVGLAADGTVVARIGTAAAGQGHETVWSAVVARALEVDPSRVRVVAGDTLLVPRGTGTFASRSAQVGGAGLHLGALRVLAMARDLAAEVLEIDAADLRYAHGCFTVAGDASTAMSLADVVRHADGGGTPLVTEDDYSPGAQTFPYGVHVAVVEVDTETGHVDLRRMAAVDDCGRVLDERIVEGQVHGSLAQGVAQALYEAVVYDDGGQPLTSTLAEYAMPSAADLPTFESARLVTPAPSNPLGVKGAGESGCIGAPPAIVNAALDALRPLGVTDLGMPLTPERVWRALQAAAGRRSPGGDRR